MAKTEIISPLPGVFYRKPSPDAPEYILEGEQVELDTTIGLIEVMKQFTEIPADLSGTLVEFCIGDSSAVEPGQVIAVVETED